MPLHRMLAKCMQADTVFYQAVIKNTHFTCTSTHSLYDLLSHLCWCLGVTHKDEANKNRREKDDKLISISSPDTGVADLYCTVHVDLI